MKCKHVFDLLPEYCSGELPVAKVEDVKSHTVQCESCRRELAIMSRAINALRAPVTQFEPPNVLAAVKTMARAQKAQRRADFFNWSIATAAACAVLVWIVAHSQPSVSPQMIARVKPVPSVSQSAPVKIAEVPKTTQPIDNLPVVSHNSDIIAPRVIHDAAIASSPSHVWRPVRRTRIYRQPAGQMVAFVPAALTPKVKISPKLVKASTDEEIPEAEHTPQVASAGNYYHTNDGYVRIEVPLPDKGERVCVATMPSTN